MGMAVCISKTAEHLAWYTLCHESRHRRPVGSWADDDDRIGFRFYASEDVDVCALCLRKTLTQADPKKGNYEFLRLLLSR